MVRARYRKIEHSRSFEEGASESNKMREHRAGRY